MKNENKNAATCIFFSSFFAWGKCLVWRRCVDYFSFRKTIWNATINVAQHTFRQFFDPGYNFILHHWHRACVAGFCFKKRPSYKFVEFLNFYRDMYWAWSFSIYVSFALIIWIQIEMWFLQSVHWSHTLYMFWAIAIIFFALMPAVRQVYKK